MARRIYINFYPYFIRSSSGEPGSSGEYNYQGHSDDVFNFYVGDNEIEIPYCVDIDYFPNESEDDLLVDGGCIHTLGKDCAFGSLNWEDDDVSDCTMVSELYISDVYEESSVNVELVKGANSDIIPEGETLTSNNFPNGIDLTQSVGVEQDIFCFKDHQLEGYCGDGAYPISGDESIGPNAETDGFIFIYDVVDPILGCTDPLADNYYTQDACLDESACNGVCDPNIPCPNNDDGTTCVYTHAVSEYFFRDEDGHPDARFYLREISTSRTEVRLLARYGNNQSLGLNDDLNYNHPDGDPVLGLDGNHLKFNEYLDSILSPGGQYGYNSLLTLPDGVNLIINSYQFDYMSLGITSLIVKLDPDTSVPANITAPTNIEVSISKKIMDQYDTEDGVLYIAPEDPPVPDSVLTADTNAVSPVDYNSGIAQSYNQLIYSSSITTTQQEKLLNSIFSSSSENINIDYNEFKNHTFFGSAELKLRNFYSKVKRIENYVSSISSSLSGSTGFITESQVVQYRKNLFSNVESEIQNFTPYEKWLYYDYQSSASYPNAGRDYTKTPPISGSFKGDYTNISTDAQALSDYYGVDLVYKISTIGDELLTSGSHPGGTFNTASSDTWDITRFWYTGSGAGGGNTGNWDITLGSASYDHDASGDTGLIYLSGSIDTTDDIDLNANPVKVENFNQFNDGYTYILTFDVLKVNDEGEITFNLGNPNVSNGNTPAKASFPIVASDAGKTLNASILIDGNDEAVPYNYLFISIKASDPFNGVIDNVNIKKSVDIDGRADIFTDQYRAEELPLSHYNGKYYLSFLAKFNSLPMWENYNASQSVDIHGNPIDPIPFDVWNGEYIQSPTTQDLTGESSESFYRYILAASQSYWRYPDNALSQSVALTLGTATEATASEILYGGSITGSYGMHTLDANSHYSELYSYGSQSILPSGELFRYYHITSSANNAELTSSYITDVKLFREDDLYSGSISDVLPFSHVYSVSSSIVSNWYDDQIYSASKFDTDNINSLFNNLPLYVTDNDDSDILKKFLALIGEHYDLLKSYIDNYLNLYSRTYDKNELVPYNLLRIIGDNFGWNFVNTSGLKNLLDYYIGNIDKEFSYKELMSSTWNNILNNLIYIYKTKGTEESIRALLNCFGVPPDIITVEELGGAIQSQTNPQINFLNSSGIRNTVGNISYRQSKKRLSLLNVGEYNNNLKLNWNTSTTNLNVGTEFIFSSFPVNTERTLLKSSGSGNEELWNLQLIQSASSTVSSSLRFRLNTSETGSLSIDNALNVTSDYFPFGVGNNKRLWHVLLQRTSYSNLTGSYELHVASRTDDTVDYYYSGSLTVTGSIPNNNFVGTGSLYYTSGSNLIVAPNISGSFTGSISEIRAWAEPISASRYYIHLFNHESVVGNDVESFQSVIYRFNYGGKYINPSSSTVIQDIGSRVSGSFSAALGAGFTNPSFRTHFINVFQFYPRSINLDQKNSNTITIFNNKDIIGNSLSPTKSVLKLDKFTDSKGDSLRFRKSISELSISPSENINELISLNFDDRNLSYLVGDPTEQSSQEYGNLSKLRKKVFDQYPNLPNINDLIRSYSLLVPKNTFNMIEELMPSKTSLIRGIKISSDILFRSKHPDIGVTSQNNANSAGYVVSTLLSDEINLSNSEIQTPANNEDTGTTNLNELNSEIIENSFISTTHSSELSENISDDDIGSESSTMHESGYSMDDYVSPSSEAPSINESSTSLSEEEVNTSGDVEQFNESTAYDYDDNYNIGSDSNSTTEAEFGDVVSPDTSSELNTPNSTDISMPDNINTESESLSTNESTIPETTVEPTGQSTDNNESNLDTETEDMSSVYESSNDSSITTEFDNFEGDAGSTNESTVDTSDVNEDVESTYSQTSESTIPETTTEPSSETSSDNESTIPETTIEPEGESTDTNESTIPETTTEPIAESNGINESELDTETEDMNSEYNGVNESTIPETITEPEGESNGSNTGTMDDNIATDPTSESGVANESTIPETTTEPVGESNGVNTGTVEDDVTEDPSGNTVTSNSSETTISTEVVQTNSEYQIANGSQNPLESVESGSVETGNENIDDAVFNNVDYDLYTDPGNTTHQIVSHLTGEFSGNGAYYEKQVNFVTIGDTEVIDLRSRSYGYLIDSHYKIRTKIPIRLDVDEPMEWDPTNPDNFANQLLSTVNGERRLIGRTTRIHIYEMWSNCNTHWGDETDFTWDTEFGSIFYPSNHFKNVGTTLTDLEMGAYAHSINGESFCSDQLYTTKTTCESADEIWNDDILSIEDPLGLIKTTTPVNTKIVGGQGSGKGNVLKVSSD